MKVPEKTHSSPCCYCGGDHKDWLCPSEQFLCKGCGHPIQFEDKGHCMSCLVDEAENQGFRWGEYR